MNTRYRTAIVLLTLLTAPSALPAQQKIDPTLEVTREFDGRMMNIHKSPLSTKTADSLRNFALDFNYTIFDKPYRDLYEFTPAASAAILSRPAREWPLLLLKGGISLPFTPEAQLYFQPNLNKGNFLSVEGGYTCFQDNLPIAELGATDNRVIKGNRAIADCSEYRAAVGYGKYWKKDMLNISVDYTGGSGNYYGPDSHTYNMVEASVRAGSIGKGGRRMNYSINIKFRHTSDKSTTDPLALNENYFAATVEVGPNFGRYNKLTILLNSENLFYSAIQKYNCGIFEGMVRYRFEKGRFLLLAGSKISGDYVSSERKEINEFYSPIFLNATLSLELIKKRMWLYGEIGGGNRLNSYFSTIEKGIRLSQKADLIATTLPLTIKAGIKGNIRSRLSYNLFADYSYIDGLQQFINDEGTNRLSAIYTKTRILSLGVEAGYAGKRVNGYAKFSHSFFYDKERKGVPGSHFGYAPTTLDLSLEYNYRERIYIGTKIICRSKCDLYDSRFAGPVFQAPSYLNLGLNITYRLNSRFAFYAKGENLLDKIIMQTPLYIEKGVSAGVGIIVKF